MGKKSEAIARYFHLNQGLWVGTACTATAPGGAVLPWCAWCRVVRLVAVLRIEDSRPYREIRQSHVFIDRFSYLGGTEHKNPPNSFNKHSLGWRFLFLFFQQL